MKGLLVASMTLALAGCSGAEMAPRNTPEAQPQVVATAATVAELDQQIRSMVGMAYAEDFAQCRLAEVGHRPCGGPQYFIAYSTASVDEKTLLSLIDEHRQLQQDYQQKHGVVGTCEVLQRPSLAYVDGRCVAQHHLVR
ncbi:hypothetical protein CWI80_03630 [Pseudidiomarina sediminum]|uniref:Uncharacterized protein n=1 Tax=Pseudidiomarina sediminum TaxID=431675 RepID=A0A432ZAN7_9GAMM|nr:hypothetical protein [Pseudidiomarina sediminum]RUO74442.1 hypothetical protein CWI80_03630 [Pseudidiomarina sediminum]